MYVCIYIYMYIYIYIYIYIDLLRYNPTKISFDSLKEEVGDAMKYDWKRDKVAPVSFICGL